MRSNTAALPTPAFIMQRRKHKKSLPGRGGILACYLLPGEADHTHDVNDDNSHGNHIAEDGLHPVLDLQTLAGVGFGNEIIPAPAITLVAAEDNKYQRTQGQQVVGNQEVPQIQPPSASSFDV